MPIAFIFPFKNESNLYIEIHKELLRQLGYDVRPLSVKKLLCGDFRFLFRRDTLVTLHWIEGKLLKKRGTGQSWNWAGFVEIAIYLALMAVTPARFVYFIHNHAAHDSQGSHRRASQRVIALFCRLATVRVVHDPSCQTAYRAVYLPHPVYWDFRPTPAASKPAPAPEAPIIFGAIGAIRPYKSLDRLLEAWPVEARLLIRGRADAGYEAELRKIIARRGLEATVTLDNRYMSDQELNATLDGLDVLLLSHAEGSALVSGAFFEGVGRVPICIGRAGSFLQWATRTLPGILAFTAESELPDLIRQANDLARRQDPGEAHRIARDSFGRERCLADYGAVLGPKAGG